MPVYNLTILVGISTSSTRQSPRTTFHRSDPASSIHMALMDISGLLPVTRGAGQRFVNIVTTLYLFTRSDMKTILLPIVSIQFIFVYLCQLNGN